MRMTMTLEEFYNAIENAPKDTPIVSEINNEPVLLSDAYYDSVNKEIHITLW